MMASLKTYGAVVIGWLSMAVSGSAALACDGIDIQARDDRFVITDDGELFAEFDFRNHAKPIIYPLYAPGGIAITRNYPMKAAVAGEAKEHPHHKSVWFAHGDVNGVDFWSERGQTESVSARVLQTDAERPKIESHQVLKSGANNIGQLIATMEFGKRPDVRLIDFRYELRATEGEIVMGDTKEGTFAIRTHPQLRLTNNASQGVTEANGQCVNSEGVSGKEIWGKKARWVYYYGRIDGVPIGVAIIDHPSNLRHPTTWHARDYGLVAANPFGLHHFQQQAKGQGDFVIPAGGKLVLRYRLVIQRGEPDRQLIEQLSKQFSQAD